MNDKATRFLPLSISGREFFLVLFFLFWYLSSFAAVGASNIALTSSVTASSENPSTGQLAVKAVDGLVDGYPGDYTKEWATVGGKAGSWIRLDWPTAYSVDRVVLYDRKNASDQVLSGTLTFSDGSSVAVGSLDNSGAPVTVTFAPRTVMWVQFTINTVSSGTINIGLMEMEVYEVSATTNTAPDSIMVLVAHPDDEALIAAGVIKNALDRGDSVKVVIATNGDFQGVSAGLSRQLESRMALVDMLGMNEDDIVFLGYPDSGLMDMYNDYPTVASGNYTSSRTGKNSTYGNRGLGNQDFHNYETGAAAGYNRENLVGDIKALMDRYRPTQIYTHSPFDEHYDHRAIFYAAREAAVSVMRSRTQFHPDMYLAIVHDPNDYPFTDKWLPFQGVGNTSTFGSDADWPNPAFTGTPGNVVDMRPRFTPDLAYAPPPSIGKSPYPWADRLSFPVPAGMQALDLANNVKYRMIDSAYVSQHATIGLVYAHGKNEEIFWKLDWSKNIAMIADITASSETTSSFQTASNIADGIPDGNPGNAQAEWVTQNEQAGAWVQLDWPQFYTVNKVVLYDRPNTSDRILSGTLTFSDGSSVPVSSALPDDGSRLEVAFASRAVTWVRFTVDAVSSTTTDAGLSEMEVLEVTPTVSNHQPFFTQGPTAGVYSLTELTSTSFSAPAYDADGDVINYTWQSLQGGVITGSGSTVTYQAPAVVGTDTITATVSDGINPPVTASFSVEVTSPSLANIALTSSVTASSENPSTGQLAVKAVDGIVDGFPGDFTKEWATLGGKAGSWIRLDWPTAYSVDRVVLYDRKNTSDQVLSGTLTFSDGSSVAVGSLDNSGAPVTVTFTPRTATWVQFTINAVSSSTINIGLMEMEVYGVLAAPNTAPQITSGPTASPVDIQANQTSQLSVTATDPEGGLLTYSWSPQNGTITGSGATVTFNPPAVAADTVVRIDLTVTDPGGLFVTGFVDVMVRNVPNIAPQITSGPTASPADIQANQTSQLSVTATDPEGGLLTYTWSPQSGTIAGSGATVTFNPPAVTADTVVRIDLTVTDPGGLFATGFVDVIVRGVLQGSSNISGLSSSVTASSENPSTGQLAVKAVDGIVDGYPGDFTKEWATLGGQGGSWIRLDWPTAYSVDRVVLYDRKNTSDQVLGGTLTFSDGSSVAVGGLDNSGAPVTVTFAPRTATWVQFTINAVSSSTVNIGLMEMEVYGLASSQTVLYREAFSSSVTGWTVIDNATSHAPSQWGVTNGVYQESSGSRYVDNVGIFGQSLNGFEIGTYSRYDDYIHGDMDLRLQLRSNDIGVIGVMFGYQDDNNYYRFSMSKREGYRRLEKKVNGVFMPLVMSTRSYTRSQWVRLRIVFQNGRIIVFMNGEQVLAVTDTSFSGGKIALWDGRNGPCLFDDIEVLTPPDQSVIGFGSPGEYFVTTTGILDLSALVSKPATVGGIEFIVDEGTGGALLQQDLAPPYRVQFNIPTAGTHQVHAYLLNGLGQRLTSPDTSDLLQSIGVNGFNIGAFGDSITSGVFDDLPTDDISQDGRDTGGGYEPVLNDQLTSYYGIPVLVVTDGHPGDTSAQGRAKIATALSRTPASRVFLLQFGTNDAASSLPPPSGLGLLPGDFGYAGSYKEAMQGIIDAITAEGKKVYVARIPPLLANLSRDAGIQTYNQVIDELVAENSGTNQVFAGPDFYTYFSNNPGQIGPDNIHPTGAGYAAMGGLWKNILVATPPL